MQISIKRKWLYVAIVVLAVAIGGSLKAENLKQIRVSGVKAEQPVVKQETKKPVKVAVKKTVKTQLKKYPKNICIDVIKSHFPKSEWGLAIAIMTAESGLRPNAIGGPNYNGTYDYGCFQINNTKRALDPEIGADIALHKYKTNRWQQWTAYTSGSYKRFL